MMMNSIGNASSETDSMIALIDGGNTQKLLDQIADASLTSSDVAEILNAASPYLSDTVLTSAINRKPSLESEDLESVIVANSPITETVFNDLTIANEELATASAISAAQDVETASTMELLQNEIANSAAEYTVHLNQLISHFIENENPDSAVNYLISIDEDYRALPFAIQLDEYDIAQSIIDKLPGETKADINLKDLYQLILDQKMKGKGLDSLAGDQLEQVNEWANENSIVGYYALNLLSHLAGQEYFEDIPVIESDEFEKSSHNQGESTTTSSLRLIPNPATNEVLIEISSAELEEPIRIDIYDSLGSLLKQTTLPKSQSQVSISLLRFGQGIYSVLLKSGNEVKSFARLIVVQDEK